MPPSDLLPVVAVVTTGARLVHDLERSIEEVKRKRVIDELGLYCADAAEPIPFRLATPEETEATQQGRKALWDKVDKAAADEWSDLPFW